MKKGGYQILELNCKGNINVLDDYKNALGDVWVNILDIDDYNDLELYLLNLFKYNKTCLLKNLHINNKFINLFCNVFTDKDVIDIYVIDSSQTNGYFNINPNNNDYFIIKLNDDYILIINLDGNAIILKLYKGAITQ